MSKEPAAFDHGRALVVGLVACVGARAVAQPSLCPEPKLGSWGQYVKVSDLSNPYAVDPEATIEAPLLTGQNVKIFDVNNCLDWGQFEDLLIAAEAEGIEVFAALPDPAENGTTSIWFGPSPPDFTGACTEYATPVLSCSGDRQAIRDCEESWRDEWLDAYVLAADTLSQLSLSYPALRGLVIDDFSGYVESVASPECLFGARYTYDDLLHIHEACHRHNVEFGFWPVIYFESFGEHVGEGYHLGVNYGVRLFSDDRMSVDLDFDPPPSSTNVYLRFLYRDSIDGCVATAAPYNLNKYVKVNGTDLTSGFPLGGSPETMAGDQYVSYLEVDIQPLLITGTNTLTFELYLDGSPGFNGCNTAFWDIWDVSLRVIQPDRPPMVIDTFIETFSTTPYAASYGPPCLGRFDLDPAGEINNDDLRCPWAPTALPDDPSLGRMARRLVAAPNREYLITGAVDGIAPCSYRMDQTPTTPCTYDGVMYTLPTYAYTTAFYHTLLSRSLVQLDGKGLMPLQLGLPLGTAAFDLDVLEDQLRVSASLAPYTMIWNQPLGVEFVDQQIGIFADHTPTSGPRIFDWMGGSYEYHFLAYWPGEQQSLDGWYQEWKIEPWSHDSVIQIRVADNRDDVPTTEYFRKVIYQEGHYGTPLWVDDFGGPDDHLESIDSSVVGTDPIVLRMELIGPVGNILGQAWFAVEDSMDAPIALDPSEWEYRTGVDPFVVETLDRQRGAYRDLRSRYGFTEVLCVLANWGPCPPPPAGCTCEFDDDGHVGFSDLLHVLSNWGLCP